MDTKTYTMESVLVEFDADSEYGKALRAMPEGEMQVAVAKLNKGATDGIKGAVKAKVISSKYSTICKIKLKEHLMSMRVDENEMFRKAAPMNSATMVGASAVSVGDWVQVDADRSPGWNSEGGIAMVTASANNFAEVK
jgi:hypothetical protein